MQIIFLMNVTNFKVVNTVTSQNIVRNIENLCLDDVFVWSYLKDRVYAHNPQTLEQFEDIVQTEIFNIPNNVFCDVIDNFEVCLRHKNGLHIEHILPLFFFYFQKIDVKI
jgi:hypothetical protein